MHLRISLFYLFFASGFLNVLIGFDFGVLIVRLSAFKLIHSLPAVAAAFLDIACAHA